MEKYTNLLFSLIENNSIERIVFSNSRLKSNAINRVNIRPINIKNVLLYQLEYHSINKVFHKNLNGLEFLEEAKRLIEFDFKQANIFTEEIEYQVFAGSLNAVKIKRIVSDKTKHSIHSISAKLAKSNLTHNQGKNHILPENEPCDFLVHLGVMRDDGSVNKSFYNKFRQINRFLEIVEDVVSELPKDRKLTIVDFGCGKAYLTFALYYYLYIKNNYDVEIVGLDLKEDVIEFCNKTAKELKYNNLKFQLGDIAKFEDFEKVDMVVTLHACDTATDFALIKAVKWDASIILSVPCCQHELYNQVNNPSNDSLLKYGILKERFASILTDGLRGLKLEEFGYNVTIIEFTSLTHTAKNIMIRGVKSKNADASAKSRSDFDGLVNFWNVTPTIGNLIK
jgi:SAM-dependent methyltransferase